MLFKNSNDALAFWQQIAEGNADTETIERLKEVAYEITMAVFSEKYDHAARRADAALRAVGWTGRIEKYPGLKALTADEVTVGMSDRDVAFAAGLVLRGLPDDFDEKVAAKSVRAYRARKPQ